MAEGNVALPLGPGEWGEALNDCNEAIRIDPDSGAAHGYRSRVYREMKEWDKMILDCDEALRINPKDSYSYANRGYAYAETKEWNKALSDCDKAVKLQCLGDEKRSPLFHTDCIFTSFWDLEYFSLVTVLVPELFGSFLGRLEWVQVFFDNYLLKKLLFVWVVAFE